MNQYAPTYACPYNVHVVVKHKMTKSEKGDNSVKHVHNLAKYYSGLLNLRHNMCSKYHGPRESGS